MKEKLTDIQKQILDFREVKGYTVEQVLRELKISRKVFQEEVNKLKEINLYNEDNIKNAIQKRKKRETYAKKKNAPKLSPSEKEYREKCIDLLARKYFHYNQTKELNLLLPSQLKGLKNIYGSYQLLYMAINMLEDNLIYAYNKEFMSENIKISYMMAIIRNSVDEVRKKLDIQRRIKIGLEKREEEQKEEIMRVLNKKIITKPTKRLDMTDLLDD